MADKAYEYMDWARIEAVVYGEEDLPREILGAHLVKKGVLIQCFFPESRSVKVHVRGKVRDYKMVQEDEAGYYAVVIPGKTIPEYEYVVEWEDKSVEVCEDPYRFDSLLGEKEERAFCEGVAYEIDQKLGAHPMRRGGCKGVYFAIWAPNALSVSVVGDFNDWKGKTHPMHRSAGSGIFELFLPCAKPGDLYKYEMVLRGGARVLRTDPYAKEREALPGNASMVPGKSTCKWEDETWMTGRKETVGLDQPLAILEVNFSEWSQDEEGNPRNYTEMAAAILRFAKRMGYTHLELNPVMEYMDDLSNGYATCGYFAPTKRYGTSDEFKEFVNQMHKNGLGVIMDWTPAHFPALEEGMQRLDGTCLYEYADVKKKTHPFFGTMMFNYDSPMVREFLIGNARYWLEEYHLDGLRLDDVDSMLYLDYGRYEGQWSPNIYGSNENLEAIEFLKQLNYVLKKEFPDVLVIAQEDGLWPQLTGERDEKCIGFDYEWNNGWTGEFLNYLRLDEKERTSHHHELTTSMLYAYCENYILTLNRRDIKSVDELEDSLPGRKKSREALIKAAYGYLMTHPGKKMLYSDDQLSDDLAEFLTDFLKLYKTSPALYALDTDPDGFQWIQQMESEKKILVFLRKTKQTEDTMMVFCNFSGKLYEKYVAGVPMPGKYKEVINSDDKKYGGQGLTNPRVKASRKAEQDEMEQSITVKLAPYSIAVFQYREK